MRHASLLSILHCSAASARSSARLFASSYEMSSSSEGPAGESALLPLPVAVAVDGALSLGPDFETDTEGDGTGTEDATVAI